MRQIVLLRGINLGSRNRIAMGELRERLAQAGYADARTYLQSGNVVLTADRTADQLELELKAKITDWFGLEVEVLVRSRDQLAAVVARNPLGEVAMNPKRYQVSFLSAEPEAAAIRRLEAMVVAPERLVVRGREAYAWYPEGIARSRLATELARARIGVDSTARNWTTVRNLLTMADA
jgi:uncharacterized protein (DUF1697 family)